MLQSIMYMILMISALTFSHLKHPLAMGFLLLIQTILICLITGMMHENFWFSYILFLVFLGGMLVLFIYVTSLASNEMFNFSLKLLLIMIFMTTILILFSLIFNEMKFTFISNNETLISIFKIFNNENFYSIYKLYNLPTNWINLLLINYLLFALIVMVKITNYFYGPIRNLN